MQPDRSDPEILAIIAASTAESFPDMANEIAAQVGPARAWPLEWVAEEHHRLYPPHLAGRRSAAERQPHVVKFVADRIGLKSVEEIARLGAEQFGAGNFPSKSAVGRLAIKLRQRRGSGGARP